MEQDADESVELGIPEVAMALARQTWVGTGVVEASNCLRMKSVGHLIILSMGSHSLSPQSKLARFKTF